jgi:uncharacterized protein (TIGR02646 family)
VRYITKAAEPHAFLNWKRTMKASPQNLEYDNLPGEITHAIKESLLNEQAFLCAYTLRRLNGADDCHIEHIQPQNNQPDLTLDYANMAACFPRSGGDKSHGYGAPFKAGVAVALNENFVSPHRHDCERRFRYDNQGGIHTREGDEAAAQTIQILGLDNQKLTELRRRAVETYGLTLRPSREHKSTKPKSAAQARQFAEEVLKPDAAGRLTPFCVVLRQVALEYAEKEEKRSQRLRAARGDR